MTTKPAIKKALFATEYRVKLRNGQWLTPSWTQRPAVVVDKADRGWEDKLTAECIASQADAEVIPNQYEYINA